MHYKMHTTCATAINRQTQTTEYTSTFTGQQKFFYSNNPIVTDPAYNPIYLAYLKPKQKDLSKAALVIQ